MFNKAKHQTNIAEVAENLRTLANENGWVGTISQLADALEAGSTRCTLAPARFAIWLRQHEHTLWWKYRIALTFSRTGKERLIHLSLRDSTAIERRCHPQTYGEVPGTYSSDAHTLAVDGNVGT
jgi:hypothetical protein